MPHIDRAVDAIVEHCKLALKDCKPISVQDIETKEELDLATHIHMVEHISYAAGQSEKRVTWDYLDQDANTFWSGVLSILKESPQKETAIKYFETVDDFSKFRNQRNILEATKHLFGRKRPTVGDGRSKSKVRNPWKLTYSRTFENEPWADDADFINVRFPRALRDLILGDGEKQFGYTREEYEIAERAFFEYVVTDYLRMYTNSKSFYHQSHRDEARAYIDKFFNQLEKDAA